MKECDNCANGAWLNGKDVITEICIKCRYICGEPTKWKEKPKTNADRIRAMSDAELEVELYSISLGRKPWCDHHCEDYADYGCDDCALEWLKQPAEVE